MKTLVYLTMLLLLFACKSSPADTESLFSRDNLVAWCIVPFDSVERTPEQRAQMLKDLGITQMAYDWRTRHLQEFPQEIAALKKADIKLTSVWIWIDPNSTGNLLDSANEVIFQTVKENNVKTDFWIGFSNNNFANLSDDEKMVKAVADVQYLNRRAKEIGCTISLYNHGDWFGEPANQVKIIENTGARDIGIVYNFHHAHSQIDEFPELLNKMLPYLRTVNLNGMNAAGPKILPLGKGNAELGMLKTLQASGFKGTIGIIGHIEEADVKVVLERNLEGLQSLLQTMDDKAALATYQ